MNIKTQLLAENSKQNIELIVDYIGDDVVRFEELIQLFFYDNIRVVQRASWAVGMCGEQHPDLIKPYLGEMLQHLQTPKHNAVRRNIVRIFQFIEIPEVHLGTTVDICFQFLNDPQEAIAVRSFSMTVLYNACLQEPLLADELRATIELHLENGSAGFKSRGRKVLKQLSQLSQS